jgi:hypothetical protein
VGVGVDMMCFLDAMMQCLVRLAHPTLHTCFTRVVAR